MGAMKRVLKNTLGFLLLLVAVVLTSCGQRNGNWVQNLVLATVKDSVTLKGDNRQSPALHTIRFAYQDSTDWPKTSRIPLPAHAAALVFKSTLEEATGGTIAVELYGGGILGDDGVTLDLLHDGRIEMAVVGPLAAKVFPSLQLLNIPFIFPQERDLLRFFDTSPFWAELSTNFTTQTGLVILGTASRGFTAFGNSQRPILAPTDVAGLTLTLPDIPVFSALANILGAAPFPTEENAVLEALRAKTANATMAPLWVMDSRRWYPRQAYVTTGNVVLEESLLVANKAFLEGLSAEHQGAVREAAQKAEMSLRVTEQLIAHSLHFAALSSVTEVHELSKEEIAAFEDATRGISSWLGKNQIGDALLDRFLRDVAVFH
jgi:C4-dicarboxylate-binding protein DctP